MAKQTVGVYAENAKLKKENSELIDTNFALARQNVDLQNGNASKDAEIEHLKCALDKADDTRKVTRVKTDATEIALYQQLKENRGEYKYWQKNCDNQNLEIAQLQDKITQLEKQLEIYEQKGTD